MKSGRGIIVLCGLLILSMVGWPWLMDKILGPPQRKPKQEAAVLVKGKEAAADGAAAGAPLATQETVAMVMGGMAAEALPADQLSHAARPSQEMVAIVTGGLASATKPVKELVLEGIPKAPEIAKVEPPKPAEVEKPPEPIGELIAIGNGGDKPFYLKALLNTHGGSVQQIVLPEFEDSDREGLVLRKNGQPVPLHLVPGIRVPFSPSVEQQRKDMERLPVLEPGEYTADKARLWRMSEPSFKMFHYEKPSDERPVLTLGDAKWKFNEAESDLKNADVQRAVFETDLGDPHYLHITKTFTLKRRDYHIGLKVDIKRTAGKKGPNQFRYQLTGANGLPIEGQWYTSTFRQAIVGFGDGDHNTQRYIEDASAVRLTEGSDRQVRTEKWTIQYAAVAVQYFASAIAVDDEQEKRNFIEAVRATPMDEHPPLKAIKGKEVQYWEFVDDLTVRAITETFNPEDISHKYLLYHGPIKVRLLRQMPKDKAVDDALVDRYLDKLNLNTLTDAPLPNALGRFANAIYWTDLVITFTNIIHSLLGVLHQVVPSLGLCVLILTLMVRGMLFPLSRRQAHNAQVMQAKMAKLQPELRKLQEKYGSDFQRMNQERMLLYKEHGVNPFAALGGCLPLLVQMPIFMGLYYALQESVFFRLDPFLWFPNLAAPDMAVFWGERIPWISTPQDLGWSLYLGPYLNVLPFIAVSLMLVQQKKMMPKSDDPQVQQQQKMMKYMMIVFGVFFYKVAAGLCLYFITSTVWGLIERKLAPKPVKPEELDDPPSAAVTGGSGGKKEREKEEVKPLGWWGRKKRDWKVKWEEVLDQAKKQQEHRRDQAPQPPQPNKGKKKKKKS